MGLEKLTNKVLLKILWLCDSCRSVGIVSKNSYDELLRQNENLTASIKSLTENKSEELLHEMNTLSSTVANLTSVVSAISTTSNSTPSDNSNLRSGVSYAAATKPKNLLTIRATEEGCKASDKKLHVAEALKSLPVVDSKFQPNGNMVMNFSDTQTRDSAASAIESSVKDVQVKKVGKIQPKIMLLNVMDQEENIDVDHREQLIATLKEKNQFLNTISDIDSKITFLFSKPAAKVNTKHVFLKISPELRNLIHNNGDKLFLNYASYQIRDRYHVRICAHCQHFGHQENDCKHRQEPPVCGKCSGNHSTKTCQVNDLNSFKCISCSRNKQTHTGHRVGDKNCPSLQTEQKQVQSITDHGF